MKFVEAHCKFCNRPLSLEISDNYADLGDPMHLVPMAACNRCADSMTRRRLVVEGIKRICFGIATERAETQPKLKEAAKSPLRTMLIRYAGIAEEWFDSSLGEFDEAYVAEALQNPADYLNVLDHIWRAARLARKPAQQQAML